MLGNMQQHTLGVAALIDFADRNHGDAEVVSRRVEGDIHRTDWRRIAARARRIARWLDACKVGQGERVATIAWNGYRHLELYYGVSASGRVLHTLNPRLAPAQLAWIINDAQDRVVCFDATFLPLVQAVRAQCPSVAHWVLMSDADRMPSGDDYYYLENYEVLLHAQPDNLYPWPQLEAHAASSLCYTSGTTGNPKGVLYSHFSTVLHAYAVALPDSLNLSSRSCVLPVVPMFHVNAWGLPYAAALTGAKLVFPGPALDGKSVYELMEAEAVDVAAAAGVPTVWQMLLDHMDAQGLRFSTLQRTVVGGSACPPAMMAAFRERYGVDTIHAWGMTELSPLGTVNTLKKSLLALPQEEQLARRRTQGRTVFGVDMRIVDSQGADLPFDGHSPGELLVRGPWVVQRYFNQPTDAVEDGWFRTGDIATIDPDGYLQITDRAKDVIKSGGEWISSIEVDNIAMSHPHIAAAACIAMPHPKWDERPLLVVVRKPGVALSAQEVLAFMEARLPKWQVPDAIEFLDTLPMGATGKVVKHQLRQRFASAALETA
ncbi:3-(methylthio)propionyl-CoA ligase [Rhodoferax mekongensis]|uniref:3-(methylthio)propionyl-CoA ligase n=1 Tax=Rhodoferax mekongensis TaxID=3068341 RepID=UPI0028BF183D|nr:3-(methylthio)propionyl-CoA ligase [Rhodoferax sp. TBRC 17199]MDT7516200.1 3-(methylthio)propionyl-CoA ligase [Rhodoferax sp. TBRC 17199]